MMGAVNINDLMASILAGWAQMQGGDPPKGGPGVSFLRNRGIWDGKTHLLDADSVYAAGMGRPPARKLGKFEWIYDNSDDETGGMYYGGNAIPAMGISRHVDPYEADYAAAHEFGHLIGDVGGGDAMIKRTERTKTNPPQAVIFADKNPDPYYNQPHEVVANLLAPLLLSGSMPQNYEQLKAAYLGNGPISKLDGYRWMRSQVSELKPNSTAVAQLLSVLSTMTQPSPAIKRKPGVTR